MNQIKFFNKENLEFEITEGFVSLNTNDIFLGKLLRQEELEGYTFKVDEEEPKEITNLFHLKVNVKHVGSVSAFYQIDSFNKEELIHKISALREIKVENEETAKQKVDSLLKVFNEVPPLFVVYRPRKEKYCLKEEEVSSLEHNFSILYHVAEEEEEFQIARLKIKLPACLHFKKKGKKEKTEEPQQVEEIKEAEPVEEVQTESPVEEQPVEEEQPKIEEEEKSKKEPKVKKEKKPFNFKEFFEKVKVKLVFFFEPFNKKKFYFLFLFVSSFLVEFTISVGMYHCYAGKMLLIFFFIVALVGAVLNYFVIKDIKNIIMDYRVYSLLIITDLLGIGTGVGGLAIYNATQKEIPSSLPPFGSLVLYSLLISLGVIVISTVVGLFIPWTKKKSDK